MLLSICLLIGPTKTHSGRGTVEIRIEPEWRRYGEVVGIAIHRVDFHRRAEITRQLPQLFRLLLEMHLGMAHEFKLADIPDVGDFPDLSRRKRVRTWFPFGHLPLRLSFLPNQYSAPTYGRVDSRGHI